jgi:hypothetical protein
MYPFESECEIIDEIVTDENKQSRTELNNMYLGWYELSSVHSRTENKIIFVTEENNRIIRGFELHFTLFLIFKKKIRNEIIDTIKCILFLS